MLLEQLLLFVIHKLQRLAHKPRAFRIFDIRTNLPQHFRRCKRIKDIILNLEIFPEDHTNVLCLFVKCLPLFAIGVVSTVRQCQCTGEVKAVITCLVSDTSLVPIKGKPSQIQRRPLPLRIGCPISINVLPHLSLKRRINKEFQQLHIRWVLLEMPPQRLINHILENQSIINGIVLCNTRTFVPTGRSTAGDTRVHNIIGHQEERLQPLHLPP
mmetsp:Transcript_16364/g.35363  ORF Transcript_16364/g.35363 Transcript_16364/m.35363 type:complete len:213 (+) Transcript_16364:1850-2488(+)